MKRLLALVLTLALALPFAALAAGESYEIALVTDVGNIDDESFNQASWEGVMQYAQANGKSYNYYRPSEDSTDARVESIGAAVDKGAKVVVLPGFLFEDAVAMVQDLYPQVAFVILDTDPAGDYDAPNTYSIYYQEEQAGYLAGYAVVKDGYTKLGFLGGIAVPAVVRYGYGFVQGAEAAAAETGAAVEIKYWYSDAFWPTDDIKIKMSGWFTEGTEIVFACGGGIYISALAAADEADARLVGVDVDQGWISERIVTSAMKGLSASVVQALTAFYDNGGVLPEDMAGKIVTLGAKVDGVGLPTAEKSWRFNRFTLKEYEAVFGAMKDGTLEVSAAIDAPPEVQFVTVDYQN